MLHRDVKPANVLLAGRTTVKVADFGIAKALHASPRREPTTGMVFGTPTYLAPERARGSAASVAADLWSVGVVLYEALVGRKPFEGDDPFAVADAAAAGRYRRLVEARPGTSQRLVEVIGAALEADPSRRPGSAAEMAGELRSAAVSTGGLAVGAALDPAPTERLDAPTRVLALAAFPSAADHLPPPPVAASPPTPAGPASLRRAAGGGRSATAARPRRRGLAAAGAGLVLAAGLVAGMAAIAGGGRALPVSGAPHRSTAPSAPRRTPSVGVLLAPSTTAATTAPSTATTTSTQPAATAGPPAGPAVSARPPGPGHGQAHGHGPKRPKGSGHPPGPGGGPPGH